MIAITNPANKAARRYGSAMVEAKQSRTCEILKG
jgi:hypothetical protein